MDSLNATIVDTTFDVYDLLNDQCDEPLPEEFEDAYGSPRSLLFFALAAIPALVMLEVTLHGKEHYAKVMRYDPTQGYELNIDYDGQQQIQQWTNLSKISPLTGTPPP